MGTFIAATASFVPRFGLFIGFCVLLVLVVGVSARLVVFEDVSKREKKKAPSDTTPPRPASSGEPGVTAT